MKTLKDLLKKETRVTGHETVIDVGWVKIPHVRKDLGDLTKLEKSIHREGLRLPITVWSDGTLISGQRRLAAHATKYPQIPAVIVDTIEDAAKRMLVDNGDEDYAIPLKPSEMCRWFDVMRELDAPAAAMRLDYARRQGVELRRATQAGKRKPGRSRNVGRGEEYLLSVLSQPFGMSEATASRVYALHKIAHHDGFDPERRKAAADSLAAVDRGETSIWRGYATILKSSPTKAVTTVKTVVAAEPAPAAKQQAAWARSLPQLEGLTAGLAELGHPNPDLTWEQVGPVHARLMKVRRDLEQIIKGMKETAQS